MDKPRTETPATPERATPALLLTCSGPFSPPQQAEKSIIPRYYTIIILHFATKLLTDACQHLPFFCVFHKILAFGLQNFDFVTRLILPQKRRNFPHIAIESPFGNSMPATEFDARNRLPANQCVINQKHPFRLHICALSLSAGGIVSGTRRREDAVFLKNFIRLHGFIITYSHLFVLSRVFRTGGNFG